MLEFHSALDLADRVSDSAVQYQLRAQAVDRYTGHFLDGYTDEWVILQSSFLLGRCLDALEWLVQVEEAEREWLERWRRVMGTDPSELVRQRRNTHPSNRALPKVREALFHSTNRHESPFRARHPIWTPRADGAPVTVDARKRYPPHHADRHRRDRQNLPPPLGSTPLPYANRDSDGLGLPCRPAPACLPVGALASGSWAPPHASGVQYDDSASPWRCPKEPRWLAYRFRTARFEQSDKGLTHTAEVEGWLFATEKRPSAHRTLHLTSGAPVQLLQGSPSH